MNQVALMIQWQTWLNKLGSMFKGKRKTANRDIDVNALAGVKSPPSKVNIPNEVTVTRTGMLFSIKVLSYIRRKAVREVSPQ